MLQLKLKYARNYFSARSRVKGYLELYLAYVPEQGPDTSGRLSSDNEREMIGNAGVSNISHIPSVRNYIVIFYNFNQLIYFTLALYTKCD